MNDDLLKKLLQGIQPQDELSPRAGYSPSPNVMPDLTPSGPYPSPMAYPERTLDFTNEAPDVIQGSVPKPTIKPPLPFMPKQELPVQQEAQAPVEKKASLADLLANLPKPESDNELMNKQANANDTIRNILMARAANKIGASIAGVNADEKYGQDFVDLANKDVTDLQARRKSEMEQEDQLSKRKNQVISEQKALFELGDKEKENDPNSDVSKAFREYAKSYVEGTGIKIDDRMSMADLQNQMGIIGQKVQMKMSQDLRRDQIAAMGDQKAEAKREKSELQGLNWADQSSKDLMKNPYYKSYSTIKKNSQVFDAALKDPSGVMDLSALYSFVKFLDQDSAVREGEIDLLMKSVGGIDSIKQQVEKAFTQGKTARVLPNSVIQAMIKSNEVLKKNLTSGLGGEIKRLEQQAGKRKADIRDAVSNYDEIKADLDEYAKLDGSTNSGEIKRKTKDGKIAIYDSNKNFLRYEK